MSTGLTLVDIKEKLFIIHMFLSILFIIMILIIVTITLMIYHDMKFLHVHFI